MSERRLDRLINYQPFRDHVGRLMTQYLTAVQNHLTRASFMSDTNEARCYQCGTRGAYASMVGNQAGYFCPECARRLFMDDPDTQRQLRDLEQNNAALEQMLQQNQRRLDEIQEEVRNEQVQQMMLTQAHAEEVGRQIREDILRRNPPPAYGSVIITDMELPIWRHWCSVRNLPPTQSDEEARIRRSDFRSWLRWVEFRTDHDAELRELISQYHEAMDEADRAAADYRRQQYETGADTANTLGPSPAPNRPREIYQTYTDLNLETFCPNCGTGFRISSVGNADWDICPMCNYRVPFNRALHHAPTDEQTRIAQGLIENTRLAEEERDRLRAGAPGTQGEPGYGPTAEQWNDGGYSNTFPQIRRDPRGTEITPGVNLIFSEAGTGGGGGAFTLNTEFIRQFNAAYRDAAVEDRNQVRVSCECCHVEFSLPEVQWRPLRTDGTEVKPFCTPCLTSLEKEIADSKPRTKPAPPATMYCACDKCGTVGPCNYSNEKYLCGGCH